jgi:hypothetical protein
MMLAESAGSDVRLRVEVVRRLAPPTRSGTDWESLPYVDVDAALLGLRQFLAGDRLVAEIQCPHCGVRGDVELSILEYLRANRPRTRRGGMRYRIPTVRHVLAAVNEYGAGESALQALETQCIGEYSGKELRRAREDLERTAPPLGGPIEGACPHCAGVVLGWFDPGAFVIAELRTRAMMLMEEVHLLASRYGWSEDAILALPGPRRGAYAEMIAAEARAQ